MVTVVTSRLSDISMEMPISLSVIDADTGDEISNVPLIQCGGYLTGSVTIPDTIFQYQLRGTDVHGLAFQHTSNHLINSTSVDERSVIQLDCPTTPPTRPPGGGAATIFMSASIICNLTAAAVVALLAVM